jgi:hypothetical protein
LELVAGRRRHEQGALSAADAICALRGDTPHTDARNVAEAMTAADYGLR